MSSAGQSSVGHAPFYEAGDQRNEPMSVANQRERHNEGVHGSHKNLDSKDERSIANKLTSQGGKNDPSHHHNNDYNPEAELSKQDPTKPVSKGNNINILMQSIDTNKSSGQDARQCSLQGRQDRR